MGFYTQIYEIFYVSLLLLFILHCMYYNKLCMIDASTAISYVIISTEMKGQCVVGIVPKTSIKTVATKPNTHFRQNINKPSEIQNCQSL